MPSGSLAHRALCLVSLLALSLLSGCGESDPTRSDRGPAPGGPLAIATDRAAYRPGEVVTFTLSGSAPDARVRYRHLGDAVDDAAVPGTSWSWAPPATDFRGYLAEVYRPGDAGDEILATVGIDVSSDWTRFPRYGFLSDFGDLEPGEIEDVIENLSRHHINALQFYDWHHAHHRMVPGSPENPHSVWTNIFGADVHLATVDAYIQAAHQRNMAAMFYNLIYGALENAAADGVSDDWYLYTDPDGRTRDRHSLSAPFVSDIYLTDPSHSGWRDYLAREIDRVYAVLRFDGFHMDQLGDRGTRYTRTGEPVNLASTFEGFITEMHAAHPGKVQVLNAVNQYGQPGIAASPTPFLYTEVWPPNESHGALAQLILDNDALSGGRKNSVLAAYVNYGLADQEGVFHTPSVLLTDAVIFAFGGSHLELGEHMLGKEFFPNDNLAMRTDLKKALVSYYDFLVAYQNLLRDGGAINEPQLTTTGVLPLGAWPPQRGHIAVVGREVGDRQVLHLLNFSEATTLSWRDDGGVQAYPRDRTEITLTLATDRKVERIWAATPDHRLGAPQEIEFTQSADGVSFTLPFLRYWSMVVVEYR